jgi:hypothetical protein
MELMLLFLLLGVHEIPVLIGPKRRSAIFPKAPEFAPPREHTAVRVM